MKIIAITQARTGSTRLPAKVLKMIADKTLLDIHLQRLKKANRINEIIVATTVEPNDVKIVDIAKKNNLLYYCGSEDDVLDRYYQAAKIYLPDYVVRVTSDCPLIDPKLIDSVIDFTINGQYDYVSNVMNQGGYPDGEDVEVFRFSALEQAWKNAKLKSEREHVTSYIRNNSSYYGKQIFNIAEYPIEKDYTFVRLTVDEQVDFEAMKIMISTLGTDCTWQEYTNYYIQNNIDKINGMLERGAGYKKSLKND